MKRSFDSGKVVVKLGIEVGKAFQRIPLIGRRTMEKISGRLFKEPTTYPFQQVIQIQFKLVD